MASYAQALVARKAAFDTLSDKLHMRPIGAGLIEADDGNYSLKVILPASPAIQPPTSLNGVAVEYHIAAARPELLGTQPSAWRAKSLARRRG